MFNKIKNLTIGYKIILVGCLIILSCAIYTRILYGPPELNSSTMARISKVQISYNPKYSRTFLNYQFTANGEIYENSVTSENLREEMHIFEGKCFPVLYFDKNPRVATILISKQNFLDNSIAFPDSLEWVCKYIDCDVGL